MERLLFIDELSVHADFQRHGIGRALMKRALGEVRKGLDGAALTTDRELPWNAPFYASLGFEELDDPPPAIAAELADEEADGFDMTRRCAMMLRFG
jgi:GNAT superfamily N-acetyltransferase